MDEGKYLRLDLICYFLGMCKIDFFSLSHLELQMATLTYEILMSYSSLFLMASLTHSQPIDNAACWLW